MLSDGRQANKGVAYVPDSFVWHAGITRWTEMDLVRVSYYTSVVGDDEKVSEVVRKISATRFSCKASGKIGSASIIPRVSKRPRGTRKEKTVDIAITMDVIRTALILPIDGIYLLSGDADYLPLIEEITRSTAKQVYIGAFSSGLAAGLRTAGEHFIDLDAIFFERPTRPAVE